MRSFVLAIVVILLAGPAVRADDELYERAPIGYSKAVAGDPVARLQARIAAGETKLEYDEERGYLPGLLKALGVPVSSQVLVFSKTSFQRELIGPARPRALYFNDDVYVGYVSEGDVIELTAMDPVNGPIFYTLRQRKRGGAKFLRATDECLQCHAGSMTNDLPGHIVRSVFPDANGQAILSAGTFRTNHTSPLKQRWGGWYVTGTSGAQVHMGNVMSPDRDDPEKTDFTAGTNVTSLAGKFDTSLYLSPHSDIVALMVLEHQMYVQNLITRANFLTRAALHDEAELNKALGRPAGYRSDSTTSRIKNATEPLLKGMLLCGEATLTGRVEGTSGFEKEFAAGGVKDASGRSLRALNLERRLFRLPLSYLIYSDGFAALPGESRAYFWRRLGEVLSGADRSKEFEHLSEQDRSEILAVVRGTVKGLPAGFGE